MRIFYQEASCSESYKYLTFPLWARGLAEGQAWTWAPGRGCLLFWVLKLDVHFLSICKSHVSGFASKKPKRLLSQPPPPVLNLIHIWNNFSNQIFVLGSVWSLSDRSDYRCHSVPGLAPATEPQVQNRPGQRLSPSLLLSLLQRAPGAVRCGVGWLWTSFWRVISIRCREACAVRQERVGRPGSSVRHSFQTPENIRVIRMCSEPWKVVVCE